MTPPNDAVTTALVPSLNLDRFLQSRNAILERVTQASELLRQAGELAEASGLGSVLDSTGPNASRYHQHQANLNRPGGVEEFRKYLDAQAWDYILHQTGMRSFMDNRSRQEWGEQIQACDVPELSRDVVHQNLKQWRDSRPDMMEAGVLEVFQHLSYDYKANSPRQFGKKVIIERFCSKWVRRCNGKTYTDLHFCHSKANYLEDLNRVMHVLDGKPEPDHRPGMWLTISRAYDNDKVMTLDLEYFSLRWYMKGTVHVVFKRPDLVVQMNRILNKHHPNALSPP